MLFKPNITFLISTNKDWLDIFYDVMQDEIWDNRSCRANMDYVLKLVQYFMLIDITGS